MDRLVQDLRYALRMLARNPGFTLAVVVTLAIGIGANSAVFSLVDAVLLRPVPAVEEQDRLVTLFTEQSGHVGVSSYVDVVDIRERSRALSGLAAFKPLSMDLSAGGLTERIDGMIVTDGYFDVLGVRPAVGRFFRPEDNDEPGAETVVVLSWPMWQEAFAGGPQVLGAEVRLNGLPFTVVGVAPRGFRGTSREWAPAIYAPMMMQPHFMPASGNLLDRRSWGGVLAVGRLAEGVTLEQARADLASIVSWLRSEYPRFTDSREYRLVAFSEGTLLPAVRGVAVRYGALLMGIVAAVLLIACVNVANLLLARGNRRLPEIAVRQALGAGRVRLVRQLLVESCLLALPGGGAALLLAAWAGRFFASLPLPFVLEFGVDVRLLGFTLVLALVTGLIFGLVPALRASRPGSVLRFEGVGASASRRGAKLGKALIVGQVALSALLLVGAALFGRSLLRLGSVDPGFRTEGILTAHVDPGLQGWEGERVLDFYRRLDARIEALPGVEAASSMGSLPGPDGDVSSFAIEGYDSGDGGTPRADYIYVGLDLLDLLKIEIVRGRGFEPGDDFPAPPVMVVNESAARYLEGLTGRPAVGTRISQTGSAPFFEVVGVAADAHTAGLRTEPRPLVYVPHPVVASRGGGASMHLLLRTGGDPRALVPALRSALADIDPDVPLAAVRTLEQHLGETLFAERYATVVLGLAAVLALVLAATGLYGVLSYSVSRRTREMGLRMALGADAGSVVRLVAGQGLGLVTAGLALGLVAALALSDLMAGFLYGIGGVDVATCAVVTFVLALAALAATLVPARRATRVDPSTALQPD